MRTKDFKIGEIANDFRYYFTSILSKKAVANFWSSSMEVLTNNEQNAFYFSQKIKLDTDSVIACVYKDIQDTLQEMRGLEFSFDVLTVKKAYSIEVTNIKFLTDKAANKNKRKERN